MKNIIVYFSHNGENYFQGNIQSVQAGNTQRLCQKLKTYIEADLFELIPLHDYPADYLACTKRAKDELNCEDRPKIVNVVQDMSQYENIYLAYPNWWGTYPRIIATFIESYDLKDKHLYPICTHEGSGLGKSVEDLKKALPESIVHTGLAVQGSYVDTCDEILKEYIGGANYIKYK